MGEAKHVFDVEELLIPIAFSVSRTEVGRCVEAYVHNTKLIRKAVLLHCGRLAERSTLVCLVPAL